VGELRQRGFSLLELLVALFVIVLVTSLATLNVGSGARDLQLESTLRTLADTNSLAADEAQMSGRDYGLLLQQVSVEGETVYRYAWRERRPEGWRLPRSGSELFAERDLPPSVELELQLEGQLSAEPEISAEPETATPQVIFYASGEVTPGAIDLRRREDGRLLWRLEWDLLGRSELLPRGRPAEERDDV
jgi:general secretion pathway protein H